MFEEQQTTKRVQFVSELSRMGKRYIISVPKPRNQDVEELYPDKPLKVTLEEVLPS